MDVVVLIARILFVAIFLASGIGHLVQTEAMAGYAKFKGVPAPKVSTIVSGLLMLVAIAPIPLLMHRYWNEQGEARMNEQVQFNKTVSLVGGALALFALFALVPTLGLTITGPLFNV